MTEKERIDAVRKDLAISYLNTYVVQLRGAELKYALAVGGYVETATVEESRVEFEKARRRVRSLGCGAGDEHGN